MQQDTLWLLAGGSLAVRMAYAPGGELKIFETSKIPNSIKLRLNSPVGEFNVQAGIEDGILHYVTSIIPEKNLSIPFWPRDIVVGYSGTPD